MLEKPAYSTGKRICWTAVEGEKERLHLYNKASNKYMHFESGNRAVTLTDEATYYEAVLTDHHAAGKALAFTSWNMVSELFRKPEWILCLRCIDLFTE